MPRKKVTAEPILRNYEEVDNAIRNFAQYDAEIEAIAAKQQEAINKIKEQFEKQAEPLISKKIRVEKDLQEFCEFYKDGHFSQTKSKKLTFGVVGFRKSSKLKYLGKWKLKDVIAKIKEIGLVQYVEEKPTLKRDDIRKHLISGQLHEDTARTFGCWLEEKDEFYFEPDKAAVANAIKKMEVVRKAS